MTFLSWASDLIATPLSPYWMTALATVFLGALSVLWVVARDIREDWASLRRLQGLQPDPEKTAWERSGVANEQVTGALGQWQEVLRSRRLQNQPSGAEQLLSVLAARYDWAEPWLSVLRSSCTLIGLLCTFIGLAMSLGQLSSALSVVAAPAMTATMGAPSNSQVDIVATLNHVRESLPGLGTAFGASITGIFSSLVIGLIWAKVGAEQAKVVAAITRFSAEHMEPVYALPTGDQQVVLFMEQQASALQQGFDRLVAALNTSKAEEATRARQQVLALEAAGAAMKRMADDGAPLRAKLAQLSMALTAQPEEIKKVWATIFGQLEQQQRDMAKSVEAAASAAGAKLVSSAEVAGGHLETSTRAATGTLTGGLERARGELDLALGRMVAASEQGAQAQAAAMAQLRAEGQVMLGRISTVMGALVTSAEKLGDAMARAGTDLQVSESHVLALTETTRRLADLLNRTEDLLEIVKSRQLEDTRRLAQAFEAIPIMAEVVTAASRASTQSVDTLQTVMAGADMERYLRNLPELVRLSESERSSREALAQAVASFAQTAEAVGELNRHVQRISQTSQGLERAHAQVAEVLRGLARDQLGPAVGGIVHQAATSVLQRSDQSWDQRQRVQHEQMHAVLQRLERDMARLAESQNSLASSQQLMANSQHALLAWFQKPYWSRLLGRQDAG